MNEVLGGRLDKAFHSASVFLEALGNRLGGEWDEVNREAAARYGAELDSAYAELREEAKKPKVERVVLLQKSEAAWHSTTHYAGDDIRYPGQGYVVVAERPIPAEPPKKKLSERLNIQAAKEHLQHEYETKRLLLEASARLREKGE